jgi:hypothetical protein
MAEENEDPEYPETPELDKMAQFTDKSQHIGEFLDWLLGERNLMFARWPDEDEESEWSLDSPIPECLDINGLLAEYFGVDLVKVENERRSILEYLRGKWKDEPVPPVKVVVTSGDDVEETEIKGEPIA